MIRMRERRSEVRLMCADMIQVRWKFASGKVRRATALLEDISASGACLHMETPVPRGSEIRWNAPGREFQGLVRYCVYREIGYFVGIAFRAGTKWSPQAYRPEHLFERKAARLTCGMNEIGQEAARRTLAAPGDPAHEGSVKLGRNCRSRRSISRSDC
jgi:hypothetical protein